MTDLTFRWNETTLVGSLHLPPAQSSAPHPAVLMLQGSGPADRDSGGFFPPIRESLLNAGVATFAFDKPGCGSSTGDWRRHGLEARAEQAVSALEAVRGHPTVDAERVGVFGHSQGGWVVHMLADRLPGLTFAVANSGPSIGVADQILYDCEHTLRDQGYSESEIEEALAFVADVQEAANRNESFPSVEARLLENARGQRWYDNVTIADADDWDLTRLWSTEPYEPIESLSRIRCPFLAVYGGLDLLVPAWRGAKESGDALHSAGNRDATVVVFPAGNHRLQLGETEEFVLGYLDLLGDWIGRRVQR